MQSRAMISHGSAFLDNFQHEDVSKHLKSILTEISWAATYAADAKHFLFKMHSIYPQTTGPAH